MRPLMLSLTPTARADRLAMRALCGRRRAVPRAIRSGIFRGKAAESAGLLICGNGEIRADLVRCNLSADKWAGCVDGFF